MACKQWGTILTNIAAAIVIVGLLLGVIIQPPHSSMRPTVKNVNSDFNGIAAVQRECNTYTVCKAL